MALYAFIAQTLLATAIPARSMLDARLAGEIICGHDATEAPGLPSDGNADHLAHKSCCTAACTLGGMLPPPEPNTATVAFARSTATVSWQAVDIRAAGPAARGHVSARGPPA